MSNLGNWFRGLRGKLLLMVILPVTMIGGISFLALNGIHSQQQDMQRIARERLKITTTIDDMRIQINAVGRLIWVAYAKPGASDARKAAIHDAVERMKLMNESADAYVKMPISERARTIFTPLHQIWKQTETIANEVLALLEKNDPASDSEAKRIMLANYGTNANKIVEGLIDGQKVTFEVNDQIVGTAEKNAENVKWTMILGGAFGCFALFAIGFVIASRLARLLTGITDKLGDASHQVGSASQQLSAASQQLSSGATEGAASLEETVSSIEELTSMVKINADHSSEASHLSQTSSQSADDGELEIKKLIEAMAEISRSSKKIEEIINVIDDIAFQTNLLALNAAVEAARAGEQGKGFAVVAEAVRNLAQRSSAAAKDISGLIKESVSKTENGSQIADQSGAVLKNIVSSIKKVADLNGEIASASKQQAEGLGQISQAMTQLDTVTQQNAASAEEAAASSEELSSQAVLLQEMVKNLTAIVQGTTDTSENGPVKHAKPAAFTPKKSAEIIPFEPKKTVELAKTGTEGF